MHFVMYTFIKSAATDRCYARMMLKLHGIVLKADQSHPHLYHLRASPLAGSIAILNYLCNFVHLDEFEPFYYKDFDLGKLCY